MPNKKKQRTLVPKAGLGFTLQQASQHKEDQQGRMDGSVVRACLTSIRTSDSQNSHRARHAHMTMHNPRDRDSRVPVSLWDSQTNGSSKEVRRTLQETRHLLPPEY